MYYQGLHQLSFFPVVFRTHRSPRIQRMPASFSSRANVYTTDGAEAVRICMCHVSPCNCNGSSSRRDCYIVSDSGLSARHRTWVSLLSFLLHIALRVVSLEWNFCSLQQRTLQDMKMVRKLAIVWTIKMYRPVRILCSQFIKQKKRH